MKLKKEFYLQDVVSLSKQLLGKRLCSFIDGNLVSGIITETEAYAGVNDKASHAYGNRRTKRTESMYLEGGVAYVYLCYGIHYLFNVVANNREIPEAALIRGIKIDQGLPKVLERRKKKKDSPDLCIGPGKVSQALGITTQEDRVSLLGDNIWMEETNIILKESTIKISERIGIDYAEEDALLPYRFELVI